MGGTGPSCRAKANLAELGDAQMLLGQQALAASVVDGVSTLDRLISKLSQGDKINRLMPNGKAPKSGAVLPPEERAKAEWRINPEIRNEFSSIEAYTAWLKYDERIKAIT